MVKLSLITDEVSQNLREAADFALRNGISAYRKATALL